MRSKNVWTLLGTVAVVSLVAALATAEGPGDKPAEDGDAPAADHGAAKPVSAEDQARLDLPVAKLDGETLTVGYFESAAERQSPLMRKELADPAKRKEFLEKLINMELLAAEAKRRGFDKHAEVEQVLKNQLASLMHRQIAEGIKDAEPTDDDLRAYYDAHQENYNKPEKVRARHILISDKDKAEKLLADVLKKKPSQYEFRRLAQENSEDEATRLRGGDLTFFPRPGERREGDPEIPDAVAAAAFDLKENGDIGKQLVKSDQGYHVVMRTGYREKMSLSFEESRDRLKLLVQRDQRKDSVEGAIDALKSKFEVELHEENLKDVVIDLSGGPPAPNAKGGLTKQEREKKRQDLEERRKGE